MPPRFDTSVYTVGWVCAIKDEVTASRAFLDEEHEQPPRRPNDNNVYIVGAMGEHKVVIAFPGAGSYSADVIAHTVAHMVRTFQSIRFGLMVGIGGGAPSAPDPKNPLNDIRLGDVVVSEPNEKHSKIQFFVNLRSDSGTADILRWYDSQEIFGVRGRHGCCVSLPMIIFMIIRVVCYSSDNQAGKVIHKSRCVHLETAHSPGISQMIAVYSGPYDSVGGGNETVVYGRII